MLVQFYPGSLRLITQNDHALLSGKLADLYRVRLPFELSLAVSLHDIAWIEADDDPLFCQERGTPYSFTDYPLSDRIRLYQEGIGKVSRIHPYAGYLISLHYQSFLEGETLAFVEEEEKRRASLRERIPHFSEKQVNRDLQTLKFFDSLSLWICLASPGVLPCTLPSWLKPELLRDPFAGERYRVEFLSEKELVIEPYPFLLPKVELLIPYREVPYPLPSREIFRECFLRAPLRWIPFLLLPGKR
jgi:hypothetical protein